MTPSYLRTTFCHLALGALALIAHCGASAQSCAIPSQRDATCVGSQSAEGTKPTDNSTLNTDPRGANAKRIVGVEVPAPVTSNSCVSVPFVSWALDPVSYRTQAPSFVTPAGSGYLGSGGSATPSGACLSDSDGTCTTWVPASHPNLFLGNGSFVTCNGASVDGSVSCPISGSSAYVTANANAGTAFSAFMIACKTAVATPGMKVLDAPFSWWSNCGSSGLCSFYYIFPPSNYESSGGS